MAISALVVTGPAGTGLPLALGGIGTITASWGVAAPTGQGCLPYMQAAKFKVYVGTDTVFAHATLAATVPNGPYTAPVPGGAVSRNLWIVAVDPLGYESAPAGPVSATTLPTPASADDLEDLALEFDATIDDLDTTFRDATTALAARSSALEATVNNPTTGVTAVNAKVTTEQNARVTADSALGTRIDSVSATVGDASADARIEYQADAGPSSAASSITLKLRRTIAGAQANAGMRFSMPASGLSTVDFTAAQLRLLNASGAAVFLVNSDGTLAVGTVKATNVIADNLIVTSQIQPNQITRPGPYLNNAAINVEAGTGNVQVANAGVATNGGRVEVTFTAALFAFTNGSNYWGTFIARLYRGGSTVVAECTARPDDEGQDAPVILHYIDDNPAANSTWTVGVQYKDGSPGPGVGIQCKNRYLSTINTMR